MRSKTRYDKPESWSEAEWWMWRHLKKTRLVWLRPVRSQFSACESSFEVRIVLLGPEADAADAADGRAADGQGVMELRVREFNDEDSATALEAIRFMNRWAKARRWLGLPMTVAPSRVC
jgi:hypothetical protein